MKIAFSEYKLVCKNPIESKQVYTSRTGALLKFDFPNGNIGYADCHPWIEAGDASLENQLKALSQGEFTPLTKRSLAIAELDSQARSKGASLFHNLTIPKSHFFIANIQAYDSKEIAKAMQEGFTYFKVKLGRDLPNELPCLKRLMSTFNNNMKVRLDFNLKLSKSQFEHVCRELAPLANRIDFCEDPFPFSANEWRDSKFEKFALACDSGSEKVVLNNNEHLIMVVKPAVQDITPFLKNAQNYKQIVFTSYLDHPLGQLSAAYFAGMTLKKVGDKVGLCGLLSHHAYHSTPFSEQLAQQGPDFLVPDGTGLGFDGLLAKQKWTQLYDGK